MQLTLAEIATMLHCRRPAVAGTAHGYAIDSRTVKPGDVFFALRGGQRDGHDFVLSALGAGALAAVVEQEVFGRFAANFSERLLPVADTTEALQMLALAMRHRWGGKVIGVTGSAGKTTTKEMVARVLGTRLRVLKNEGNLNNHLGVPLSLLRLTAAHEVAVLEMGMNHAGEIRRLAEIAAPQVGVFTIVGPAHLEFFGSMEGIAAAKRELAEALPAGGVAVLNADDPYVRRFEVGQHVRRVFYGEAAEELESGDWTVGIAGVEPDETGSRVTLVARRRLSLHPGEGDEVKQVSFHLPLLGRHQVGNAAAAVAAGLVFGVSLEEAAQALEGMRAGHQRGEVEQLGGVTLINDCYNSNPAALRRMLEVLGAARGRRRIAVLGEMLELGPAAAGLHREAGAAVAGAGVDMLLGVRGEARELLEGAREAGFGGRMEFFEDAAACGRALAKLVQPGDVVLLKASRGVRLEAALETMKAALVVSGMTAT